MIRIGATIASGLAGLDLEWLETNGLGGFASGTVSGANTRRYHGLLVAATRPPVGRFVLLSKLEEELSVGGHRTALSCNIYPGTVHPRGHDRLIEFRLDPFPTWTFDVGGVRLEKRIFLVHGENTMVALYRLVEGSAPVPDDAMLELSPLLAFRGFHTLTHENATLDPKVRTQQGRIAFSPYGGLPTLHVEAGAERIEAASYWYRNLEYPREAERGLDYREDLFCPCRLVYRLRRGEEVACVATLEPTPRLDASVLRAREVERRRLAASLSGSRPNAPEMEALSLAADAFFVRRGEVGTSVIAGYPWFTDRGRDALLSLPGLALERGRTQEARSVLLTLGSAMKDGLIPSTFSEDSGRPEFHSVDTSLWFVRAAAEYVASTGDLETLRTRLYPAVRDILGSYREGSLEGIRAAADGLLEASEPGRELTWMEIKVGERALQPRSGKAVEVNALWYSAHADAAALARKVGEEQDSEDFAGEARRIAESFQQTFWNPSRGCLFDVVDGERRDAALRPNQIYAAGLPHSPLTPDQRRAVVVAVRDQLLTPYGLRSLGPLEAGYLGIYSGDQRARDAAYHQGSVWPFLIGPFVSAYLRVFGGAAETRREAEGFVRPLLDWLMGPGLGQLPEIFDGDPPHKPRGCTAQSWSVAEVLRAYRLVTEQPTRSAGSRP